MTKNPKDPTKEERFSAAEAALYAIKLINKAYDEMYQASMEADEDNEEGDGWEAEKNAKQAAAEALPVMTDARSCSTFISCIVWMQARGWMTASDARGHLYAAQTYMATLALQKAGSN